MSDPAWEGGWYREAHIVRKGLRSSARLLKAKFWRTIGFSSLDDFLLNFLDASFLPTE
jgi:homoserine O-acetyltransferase